jgi:two-component system response regulator PilR (NtrC family)
LRRIVSTALKLADGGATPADANAENNSLIGSTPAMDRLRELIQRVARSQAPVHISGESGTGKELVARMIHASGPRADGPFVPVNCGAIPSELMESEFFGHKRGSFTGAVNDKAGLLQSAEGGTLFLDEVADLPLHMQVKLLRVIQEKAVRPVGEQRETPIDVRILSATHKNLGDLVAETKFREDLYYRINVIEIRVPSLRERRNDIRPLANAILARLGERIGLSELKLSDEAWRAIEAYEYPGNVRELENVLERAATLSGSGIIEAEHIRLRAAPRTTVSGAQPGPTHAAASPRADAPAALTDQLEHLERDAIVKALEQTRYNKTAAAKLLGVTYRALRYKIQKLEIE